MSFPAYEFYKDDDGSATRRIPSHWATFRLKRLLSEPLTYGANEAADDDDPNQPRFVRITDVDGNGNLREETFRSLPRHLAEPYLLAEGDILLARSGATVGKSFLYRETWGECCFAGYLIRARPDKRRLNPDFLYAVCQADFYWQHIFGEQIQSTIQNVSAERYAGLPIPCPPIAEQSAIVAFLGRETAKIDDLVAEQQRLIELLTEKRQAVISHAVTKGLDPAAPMKDSGVEWLGEVPCDWQSLRLGRICWQVSDGPHFSPQYVDEGVLFLSARNVRVDGWSLDDAKFVSQADYDEFCRRVIPESGDVLYTKGGTTGVARVVDLARPFQVWVHVAVLKILRDLADPYFVAYALNSRGCYEQAQLYTRGATNNDLGLTRMVKIWMALPPLSEQRRIVEFLDIETNAIDGLVREAEAAIALLQERRSALISAAVTGKIDVRGLVSAEAEAA